jgi:L-amino acid N-acyltransferase YncA
LFFNSQHEEVGQVRIDRDGTETGIGISVDKKFREKSLGKKMLEIACADYCGKNPGSNIVAYIKGSNIASYKLFKGSNFNSEDLVVKEGIESYRMVYHG